jgi:hypothetical protein
MVDHPSVLARIIIADDHPLFRAALASLLEASELACHQPALTVYAAHPRQGRWSWHRCFWPAEHLSP